MIESPTGQPRRNTALGSRVLPMLDRLVAECPFDPLAIEASCRRVEQLARLRLLRAFQDEGVFLAQGEQAGVAELQDQLHVRPNYERLFHVLLQLLTHDGFISLADGRVVVSRLPDSSPAAYAALRAEVLAEHPDRDVLIPLVEACAPQALAVIGGRKSAVEVLFPAGSSALVENVYARDSVSKLFNDLTAHAVETLVRSQCDEQPGGRVSVLEIGAGTGGTSVGVLDRIAPLAAHVTYDYTDISPSLLQQAQDGLPGTYSNVRFKALDIGRDPVAQGFAHGGSDIVIAANVLHATPDIARTLANVRTLLRSGGVLVLSEVTRAYHFTTLTFGLTQGWWLFEDGGRIPGSPLLGVDAWRRALNAAGFSTLRSFTPFRSDPDQPPQSLIVAVCGGDEAPALAIKLSENLIWQQLEIMDAQLELLRAKPSEA